MKHRISISIGFTDLLFQILLGFVFLFVISFLMISPERKKSDIEHKSEYLVILEWDPESTDDVDIWVEDPQGSVLSYQNKAIGLMHLDKDDLGTRNDTIDTPDGPMVIKLNREVVSIRGKMKGWFTVNAHMFRKNTDAPTRVSVEAIRVNPYTIIYYKTLVLTQVGEENTVVRFRLDKNGKVEELSFLSKKLFNANRAQHSAG